MSLVLETKNINKYFKKPVLFQVLKEISFEVQKGEFASIMGKSGSGKSTLLYILSTMDTDYEGQLYLNEELVTGKPHKELSSIRNKHIGFVFQFHYLLSEFSVLENVMLPAKKLALKSHAEIEHDAMEKLKMINNPSILMGDEPTGNLDSYNSENVFQIFKRLKEEEGLSLLVVTHDEDFAKRTDRIIQMEDGRIINY